MLLQICALVNFFALLGATFLFRSGLFALLFAEFRSVVLVHPAYILLTVFLGSARIVSESMIPATCIRIDSSGSL